MKSIGSSGKFGGGGTTAIRFEVYAAYGVVSMSALVDNHMATAEMCLHLQPIVKCNDLF